jgi:hypothetical protein
MENHMQPVRHFPTEIPEASLCLRRIYLPPNGGPREDELLPLDGRGKGVSIEAADAFLRSDLRTSGAHGVRSETEDGGFICEHTVWDVFRERLGVDTLRRPSGGGADFAS